MPEQQQWFAGKPEENFALALASDTEAYGGHQGKARELTKRAVHSAIRADSKEAGTIWEAIAAQQEAAYGYRAEARQSAGDPFKLAPTSQGVEVEAALASVIAGNAARAESLAQELGKRFPLEHITISVPVLKWKALIAIPVPIIYPRVSIPAPDVSPPQFLVESFSR